MGFPKNYNRNMAINLKGDAETDNYKLIASGILSRTNSISESKSSYQYMDNRGTADTDVTGQEVSAAFTGHRKIGDAAQDYILDDVLYDLDKREVEFLDYDDSIAAGQPERLEGQGAASDHGRRQRQRGRPAVDQLRAELCRQARPRHGHEGYERQAHLHARELICSIRRTMSGWCF